MLSQSNRTAHAYRGFLFTLLAVAGTLLFHSRIAGAQLMNSDFGLTAGYNSATISGNDVQGVSRLPAFMLGVSVIHRINAMWAIQPELLYSRRGAQAADAVKSFKGTTDYIDIPILAKLSFGATAQGITPMLTFGPYAGVNLSCNLKGTQYGQPVDSPCDKLPVNPFSVDKNSIDYGLIAGGGVDWKNTGLFARYQMGMAKISKNYDPKHRVITVGARWSFSSHP